MPKLLWFAKVKPPDNFSKQSSGLEQILTKDLTSYYLNSLNDLMEIANITILLTRKVIDPNMPYKIAQIVNSMIVAKLPKLTDSPCTLPWWIVPAGKERIAVKDRTWDRYQWQIVMQIFTVK